MATRRHVATARPAGILAPAVPRTAFLSSGLLTIGPGAGQFLGFFLYHLRNRNRNSNGNSSVAQKWFGVPSSLTRVPPALFRILPGGEQLDRLAE